MSVYYVNKNAQVTGEHEVHKSGCYWMPEPQNRKYLGEYTSCHGAVKKSKEYYNNVDGCKHCSPACHTR